MNRIDPSGHDSLGEVLTSFAIRSYLFAQAAAPVVTKYAVYTAFTGGTLFIATSTAISVDDAYFGGAHAESLYAMRNTAGSVFFIAAFTADAGHSVTLSFPQSGPTPQPIKVVQISASRYPQSAQHIRESQASGRPAILTVNRSGATDRRADALRGIPTIPGRDRDEYPPAVFSEGGNGSTVRHIYPSDNRGSGATIGIQLKDVPDGSAIRLEIIEDFK